MLCDVICCVIFDVCRNDDVVQVVYYLCHMARLTGYQLTLFAIIILGRNNPLLFTSFVRVDLCS